jgi:hypothetical protein
MSELNFNLIIYDHRKHGGKNMKIEGELTVRSCGEARIKVPFKPKEIFVDFKDDPIPIPHPSCDIIIPDHLTVKTVDEGSSYSLIIGWKVNYFRHIGWVVND